MPTINEEYMKNIIVLANNQQEGAHIKPHYNTHLIQLLFV